MRNSFFLNLIHSFIHFSNIENKTAIGKARIVIFFSCLIICFLHSSIYAQATKSERTSADKKGAKTSIVKDSITIKFIDTTAKRNFYGIQVQLKDTEGNIIRQRLTDEEGTVTFLNVSSKQTYILNYAGLGYKSAEGIPIKAVNRIQLIALQTYNFKLNEVVLKSKKKRFTIRGDTTLYDAASYKSKVDENAGNLIQKLPGVQLKDGDVLVEGDKVNSILLDGKVYFKAGASTTLNQIPSEIISRIEIIDNVSPENAAVQLKTINIVTKPKKILGFGKLVTNYGSTERYRMAGNYYVKTKYNRLTAVVDANNINRADLLASELSGLFEGTNSLLAGGLNYQFESDSENTTLTFNLISNALKRNENQVFNQYLLGALDDGPILNTTNIQQKEENIYSYDILLTHMLSSSFSLSLASFGNNLTLSNNNLYTDQRFSNTVNIFNLNALTNSEQNRRVTDNTLTLSKRFERSPDKFVKNREIAFVVNYAVRDAEAIDSLSYNYDNSPSDNLWQIRNASTPVKSTIGQLRITENWGDHHIINYAITSNRSTAENTILTSSFDSEEFVIGDLETSLSSINKIKQQNYEASAKLVRNKGQTQTTLGVRYNHLSIDSDITFPSLQSFSSNYPIVLPSFSFVFNNEKQTRFKVSYNKLQKAPQFRQLNPVLNNVTPSRPTLGQPNLKPEIEHAIDLEFRIKDKKKIQHLFRFNATEVNNFIGESIVLPPTDTIVNGFEIRQGTQLILPKNFDRRQQSVNFSMNHELNRDKVKYGLTYGYRYDLFPMQNVVLAETKSNRFNSGLYCNYFPNQVFSLNFFLFSSYARIQNSLNPDDQQSVYNWNTNLNMRYLLFNSLLLNLDATSFQVGANSLPNANNRITSILNFSAKHTVFRNQNINLIFQAHDILNQNTDIVQNPTALYITQEQKVMLGRFFLLGLSIAL